MSTETRQSTSGLNTVGILAAINLAARYGETERLNSLIAEATSRVGALKADNQDARASRDIDALESAICARGKVTNMVTYWREFRATENCEREWCRINDREFTRHWRERV